MRTFNVKSQKEEVKEDVVAKESISNKVEDLNAGKVFIGVTKLGNKYQVGEKIIEEISLKKDNFNLSEDNNRLVSKEAKSFVASFAKSISDAKVLTLNKSNHEISLALKNNKRSFRRDGMCECNNNEVLYKDIEEGIDLKYSCNEEGVKESLIINKRQDNYDFDFELNIKDLTPKFNKETNRLELQKDGNTIYTILSPYMIDSNNKRSDDCYYEISQEGEALTLSLRISKEWIEANERVFPVIVDPTIKVMNDNIFHMHTSKDLLNDEPCSMKEKTLYSFIESNVNGEVFSQNVYANVRCDKISPSLRKLVNKANIT